MDLDEFLAVKDLCTGLARTESDYSDDEIEQDVANLMGDEDGPTIYGLPPSSQVNTPQLSPSCFGSDTDEGRGESVSSENPASLSSSESLNSSEYDRASSPRKRKQKSATKSTQKATPRKVRRKTERSTKKKAIASGGSTAEELTPSGVDHRSGRQSVDEEAKDEKYWERRRKNNQAAKKSRDLKRQKEMDVAQKAAVLEEENRQLRDEVKKLKEYLKTLDGKIG